MGGLVGLRHNSLNKDWAEMCGVVYNAASVTKKPKIHELASAGEAPTTEGRGGLFWVTRGDPYMKKSEVVSDLHGIWV